MAAPDPYYYARDHKRGPGACQRPRARYAAEPVRSIGRALPHSSLVYSAPVYFGHDGFEHLTKPELDYRKLLAAYMAHVIAHEGISFLEYSVPFETEFDALSEAELAELERIEAEVRISSVV